MVMGWLGEILRGKGTGQDRQNEFWTWLDVIRWLANDCFLLPGYGLG